MSDEMIVQHCSPTLAGLKTGNLFSCAVKDSQDMFIEIRVFNRKLSSKGLVVLPLYVSNNRALIYVYRPKRLEADLSKKEVALFLEKYGYAPTSVSRCIIHLMERLKNNKEFPHEIGLFLGYPIEDVRGFIDNHAQCSKCVGCWKVYGDEIKAKELFDSYEKCTDSYIQELHKGQTLEQLALVV